MQNPSMFAMALPLHRPPLHAFIRQQQQQAVINPIPPSCGTAAQSPVSQDSPGLSTMGSTTSPTASRRPSAQKNPSLVLNRQLGASVKKANVGSTHWKHLRPTTLVADVPATIWTIDATPLERNELDESESSEDTEDADEHMLPQLALV